MPSYPKCYLIILNTIYNASRFFSFLIDIWKYPIFGEWSLYIAVTFRHSCLTVFAWRRVVLRFFDPKQLLRVSCILWCYYPKCYSIIFENASLWCFIVTVNFSVSFFNKKKIASINFIEVLFWTPVFLTKFNSSYIYKIP